MKEIKIKNFNAKLIFYFSTGSNRNGNNRRNQVWGNSGISAYGSRTWRLRSPIFGFYYRHRLQIIQVCKNKNKIKTFESKNCSFRLKAIFESKMTMSVHIGFKLTPEGNFRIERLKKNWLSKITRNFYFIFNKLPKFLDILDKCSRLRLDVVRLIIDIISFS